MKAGTATITAACGGYSTSCVVTIKSKLAYKVTPPDSNNEWVLWSNVEDGLVSWLNKPESSTLHYQTVRFDFEKSLTNATVFFKINGGNGGASTFTIKASGTDSFGKVSSWSSGSAGIGGVWATEGRSEKIWLTNTNRIEISSGRNNSMGDPVVITNIILYSDEYPSGVALNDMTSHL